MWIREENPVWDDNKEDIIGGAPQGSFDLESKNEGIITGLWWKLVEDNKVIGYGWIKEDKGDAELLIAVRKDEQLKRYGNAILKNLEAEAIKLGHTKVVAVIQSENINAMNIISWLNRKGFKVVWVDGTEKSVEFAINNIKKIPMLMEKELNF